MRSSQLFTKTRKEAPADETAKNAQLLIKAGFIHKEMAGVYSFLPLGLKVLNNISQVVREEMNAIGGQEVLMPALQVKERYEATNRWDDDIVDVWFKTKLANGAELGLGFSHEENLSPIIKRYLSSYKDLPIAPYQIQMKFRNELRSKSGLMRGREFLMKDMYSYAIDQEQHDEFYVKAQKAYERVYERVGIGDRTVMVLASGGSFSKYSHEFQTFSEAGEDHVFQASDGTYYNREIAPAKAPAVKQSNAKPEPMREVEGKGLIGVEPLAKFLDIPVELTTKTMLFVDEKGQVIAAAVRGGYEVNELKLAEVVGANFLKLADMATVKKVTGAEVGYAGLLNLPKDVRIVVDESCADRVNFEMGANRTNHHSINVNWDRDLPKPEKFYDIKIAKGGDLDPKTEKPMKMQRAIEVGNIFSLGTKFSAPFDMSVTDEQGEVIVPVMGCYGIGVSRLMGAIAECMSDEKGLAWPSSIAPFQVYLARLGDTSKVVAEADKLYDLLTEAGIGVLYDDRDTRPGEKFADAELMGIPYRIVVSPKTVESSKYECKPRGGTDVELLNFDQVINLIDRTSTMNVYVDPDKPRAKAKQRSNKS
jgi:prolyl-tRNA synthetase